MQEEYKRFEDVWKKRLISIIVLIVIAIIVSANYVQYQSMNNAYAEYVSIISASQKYDDTNTDIPWTFHLTVQFTADFNETLTYIEVKDNWNRSTIQIVGFRTNITLCKYEFLYIDASFPNRVLEGDVVELIMKFDTFTTCVNFTFPFTIEVTSNG